MRWAVVEIRRRGKGKGRKRKRERERKRKKERKSDTCGLSLMNTTMKSDTTV